MVTASTLNKIHHFRTRERLTHLQAKLIELAQEFVIDLEAWAIFSNHYHFVGVSPQDPQTLKKFQQKLHGNTAREINRLDSTPGRTVWYQCWDTMLSFQGSYFARLNYVMQNPVRHGVVRHADEYPWCSAGWFNLYAKPALKKTILSFKTDSLKVYDPFDVEIEDL